MKSAPARSGASLLWLQGLACGAALAFATRLTLASTLLLAPALLAAAIETAPGRPMARTVALFGVSAAAGPLWRSWLDSDLTPLLEPETILLAWLAGGCGWALSLLLPVILEALWHALDSHRRARLTAERATLAANWD